LIDRNQGWLAEQSLLQLVASLRAAVSQTVPIEHSVISAVTEAESYTDRVLAALVQASSIRSTENQFHRSWTDRLNWLKKREFHIATNVQEVHNLRTLGDLRNAIVHGGGRMTSQQRSRVERQVGLESRFVSLLDAHAEGGRLYLGSGTAIKSIAVARAYIGYIDREARLVFPKLTL
jgi:hypothetical protein